MSASWQGGSRSLSGTATSPPPRPPPPPPPPYTVSAVTAAGLRQALEYDRRYFTLAFVLWGIAAGKRVPMLGRSDNLQNLLLLAWLCAHATLVRVAPAWYNRWCPLLRPLLLAVAYSLPVLTSPAVVSSVIQAPSQLPCVGLLIDTFLVWLGTRNAFLSWALMGCRPPLYVAAPLQLAALARIHTADFCSVQALQHPVIQRRIDVAHFLLALLGGAGSGSPLAALIPSSPEQRCRSLLLFSTSLLGVLLPMLWLVPLRQAEVCRPPPPPGVAAWLARLEQRMSSALCLLRWSPPGGAQPLLFGVDAPPLAIRWLLLIVVLWALCCAV